MFRTQSNATSVAVAGLMAVVLGALPMSAPVAQQIVNVDPNTALRGTNVVVTITGSQTIFMQGSDVTSIVWLRQAPNNIFADSVTVTNPELLDAEFTIPSNANVGLYDVNVEQVGGQVVTLTGGFTITALCNISDLAAGTTSTCDPSTDTYTQEVVVTYIGEPSSGTLDVNGQSFAISGSPQTVLLVDLPADGAAVDVTASFSAQASCSRTEVGLFTAPASCQVAPCDITNLAAGTQSACNPSDNTYTQDVIVTYVNPPGSGTLDVNGQSFAIGASPQTVTLVNLNSNGASVDVTASFSGSPSCELTATGLFTAPQGCVADPCDITALAAGTQTTCDPGTNTYSQDIIVTFVNPPASGTLDVNGVSVAIGASPQTVTLTNLTADGAGVDVTARFSAQTSCNRTESNLFTAPQSCEPQCEITDLADTGGMGCDPQTNTYTRVITVTYANAPSSGTLLVNGQSFSITGSPQGVSLVGLIANGLPVEVTASFSANTSCSRTEQALFVAPAPCVEPGAEQLIGLNDVKQSVGVDEVVMFTDIFSGVATLIGSLGDNFTNAEAMTVDPLTQTLYGIDNNRLLSINRATGAGTVIGNVGFDDIDGIAFHPTTNDLYGVTHGSNLLIRINKSTGVGTLVAEGVVAGRRLNDIAFHPDGRAYVLTGGSPRIYEIDLTTGQQIHKWTLSGGYSLEALLWTVDGVTLYSAADRGFTKDLVTVSLDNLSASQYEGNGVINFVSNNSSSFRDIEALAWLNTTAFVLQPYHWERTVSTGPAARNGRAYLHQNEPNPFNPSTRIAFDLVRGENVALSVYDIAGRRVATLHNGFLPAGDHRLTWDGHAENGSVVAAGIYHYTLQGADWRQSRRMVLLK